LPEGASRDVMTDETYGALKLLCEREVEAAFGDRALIVRPGLIVGPYDPTDRFTYWPARFARGGDVVVPDDPAAPVQFIDVRDLAAFIVDALAADRSGTVNVTGPPEGLRWETFVATVHAACNPSAHIAAVPTSVLRERSVAGWSDLPLYVFPQDGIPGLMRVDLQRARAMGLRTRPLAQTAADTLAWYRAECGAAPLAAGLSPDREAELLRSTVR
jgi:2'-hydroxyisoflavone reductase